MDIFIPSLIRPFNPNEHQDLLAIPRCLIPDNKKINIDYKVDVKKLVGMTVYLCTKQPDGTYTEQTFKEYKKSQMTRTNPPPNICCIQEFKERMDELEGIVNSLNGTILNEKMEGEMESFKKGINGRLDNHLCMFDEIHEKINELQKDLKNTQKIVESRLESLETSIIPPPSPRCSPEIKIF